MFLFEEIIALDIGSTVLKAVLFQKTLGRIQILEKKSIRFLHSESISIKDQVVEFLKNNFPGKNGIILNMSQEDVFIRDLEIPLLSEKAINEVLPFEVENVIPFSIETVEVIGKIWNKSTESSNVISYSVTHTALEELINFFINSHYFLKGLFVNSASLAAIFKIPNIEKIPETKIGQIDIGGKFTLFNVIHDGNVSYSRYFAIGGEKITKKISKLLKITEEEAEELKYSIEVNYLSEEVNVSSTFLKLYKITNKDFKKIVSTIKEVIQEISTEIQRSIMALEVSNRPDVIYLSGGSSKFLSLDTYLSDDLGIEIKRYTFLEDQDEQFLNVYGLVYHYGLPNKNRVNFLNTPYAKRINKNNFSLKEFLPHGILFVSSIILIFSVFISKNISNYRQIQKNKILLADKFEKAFKKELQEDEDPISEAKSILINEKKKTEIYTLFLQKEDVLDLLFEITMNFPSVESLAFALDQFSFEDDLVYISGRVNEYSDLGIIQESLEKSPLFKNVIIENKRLATRSKDYKVNFKMKLEVEKKEQ